MINGNGNFQPGRVLDAERLQNGSTSSRVRPSRQEQLSLVEIAKTAAEDLLDLLAAQIKLARFELAADLRNTVGPLVRLALFVPLLLVGYAFGAAALTSWLSSYWGWTGALAAVGGVQVVVAGVGMLVTLRRLQGRRLLERASADAAENVRQTITAVSNPLRASDV